ncbi:esterase-like activity of phytase family protein [Bradyrhizobium sp. GCM10027634]|uniref:esterase-like activity of phytase family protein n=1 Tax=unclassified Bradyrhizobium TaxID=2631580 RepID=UPI00188A36BC|nr:MULTISPECIES: esterase-like activity of phytase family protein [unclassified Bradyrhizobium]MDN5000683.1 esterase-like activity of phytase family protein [Bradyrhizobium sp. WYCCWR 12677]QOZ42593.1 twin-arginine translocation pathway signal [Bradyrhizobium sp. CCBAU 53340]
MSTHQSRRSFLGHAAAGFSTLALSRSALAQATPKPAQPDQRPAQPEHTVTAPVSIEVNARQIPFFQPRDRTRERFGSLQYRSGLVLTSPHRGFGGLSGFRFLDDKGERFLALSDQGTWFTGRIRYSGGKMAGLDDVEAAPILNSEGRPITEKRLWYDTESLARDGSLLYVGLERVNQIMRFDFARGGTRARGEVVPTPPAMRKLPYNKGLEALVFVPKDMKGQPLAGTLIAMSEGGIDADGNLIGFLIGGPLPGRFSIKRTDEQFISDAVLLPTGEILILERKFSWFTGINIRIRAIPLKSIAPGAVVDGPVLFEADLGHEVDNMEGIDAHVTAEGETVLTMVSDDNFSMLQRTLLLQFTLVE